MLMIACREGFESAVKELLKRRADVNMCDDYVSDLQLQDTFCFFL